MSGSGASTECPPPCATTGTMSGSWTFVASMTKSDAVVKALGSPWLFNCRNGAEAAKISSSAGNSGVTALCSAV
jgi:hypothetical protein